MIKKIYRLREGEVKKVLKYAKPFFSYHIVAYAVKNTLSHHRFGVVISGKSVKNAVHRNFFRRRIYDGAFQKMPHTKNGLDIVFLVKKQIKLDKTEISSMLDCEKDLGFLAQKIISNPKNER